MGKKNDGLAQSDNLNSSPAIRELAALSIVFATTVAELNEAAAQQMNSILGIGIAAAKTAHAIASDEAASVNASSSEEFASLLSQLQEASEDYKKLAKSARASIDSHAAGSAQAGEAQLSSVEASIETKHSLLEQAYASTIANIDVVMKNGAAYQQILNQIGAAVLTQGVSLVYSSAIASPSEQAKGQKA